MYHKARIEDLIEGLIAGLILMEIPEFLLQAEGRGIYWITSWK